VLLYNRIHQTLAVLEGGGDDIDNDIDNIEAEKAEVEAEEAKTEEVRRLSEYVNIVNMAISL